MTPQNAPPLGSCAQFGQDLRSFFQDARGQFTVFSVVSLCAGLSLCVVAFRAPPSPPAYVVYALLAIYMVAVLSDSLIALVIEHGIWQARKAPDMLVEQTGDVTNILGTTEPTASPDPQSTL